MDSPGDESVPKVHLFSALDHTLFASMLVVSALIGIYFAFFAKQKQNTRTEYLMGGKNMGIAPVSLSLISSFISGITLLGLPAEVYVYGTQYGTMMLGTIGASIGCGFIFLPVLCGLQLTTSYEYLQLRFDGKVRILGSLLYLINMALYIPIVIYVPGLAFNQVTGINLHITTALVCLVCIFYTSLGGLKAVVWTDALQTTMMFFSMGAVVALGTYSVGGFSTVWQRNEDSGRIEFFNLDPDPTVRHTFWNTSFGCIFNWMAFISTTQGMVQRFLAMPTVKKAQITLVVFNIGGVLFNALSCYCGLLIYAAYYNCDRLSAKVVGASDQLMPYYVMDVAGSFPGLPGLFMAGVFSAALSSMSTGLNSLSGVIYEDFISPFIKVKVSEERASFIMKVICALLGVFCVFMVYIVEQLGSGILQVDWSISGITYGPMLALFAMGMLFPWVNTKGALAGGVIGLLAMGVISFGSQLAVAKGQIKYEKKPLTTEGCALPRNNSTFPGLETTNLNGTSFLIELTTESSLNGTMITDITLDPEDGDALYIFRISYVLYSFMGFAISMVVGLVVSFLTGPTNPADVHIELLAPVVRPLFAHRCKSGDEAAHWKNVEEVAARDRSLDDIAEEQLPEEDKLLRNDFGILAGIQRRIRQDSRC